MFENKYLTQKKTFLKIIPCIENYNKHIFLKF